MKKTTIRGPFWSGSMLLLTLQLTHVQSEFSGCIKHVHDNNKREESLLDEGEFSNFIKSLTRSKVSVNSKRNYLLHRVYNDLADPIQGGIPLTRGQEVVRSDGEPSTYNICDHAFQALTKVLGITQVAEKYCVDNIMEWERNKAPMDKESFAALVEDVAVDDFQNRPFSFDQLYPSIRSLFAEFQQDGPLEVIDGLSASGAQNLCRQILVESALYSTESQSTRTNLRPSLHSEAIIAPAPSPSLHATPSLAFKRGLSKSSRKRRLQTSLEFSTCQSQILTSNRVTRDDVLEPAEYLNLLNTRVGAGFNSSVTYGNINQIYKEAYVSVTPVGEAGPIVIGSVPGTQTPDTIDVLWGICQAVDAAYEQIQNGGGPTPTTAVPTIAPVSPTVSPAPTVTPLDNLFLNLCNVAVRLSESTESSEAGLTQQEYVKALGILFKNTTINVQYPFADLGQCFRDVFNSYGTNGGAIPVTGAITNVQEDDDVVDFCSRVYKAENSCVGGPSPTPSPMNPTTQTQFPTFAPTISPVRFDLCLSELVGADKAPSDNKLNQAEFPVFVSGLFFGLIPEVPFSQLSQNFQNVFTENIASDGQLDINFAGFIGIAPEAQTKFLRRLCRETLNAINENPSPTPSPSPGGNPQPSPCFQALAQADTAQSGVLSTAEYTQFIATYGINAATFGELPFIVRDNYDWIRGTNPEVDIVAATSQSASAAAQQTLTESCDRTTAIVGSVNAGNNNVPLREHCFAALNSADTNLDNLMSETEYVTFVNAFIGLPYSSSFSDLEPDLQNYFNTNRDSVTGAISVNGSKQGQNPNPPTLAYLDFLCEEMSTSISVIATLTALLDKCRQSVKIANTNSDNAITQDEYVALIYAMADQNPAGVTFADLSTEAQSYYQNFAGIIQSVDLSAFVNEEALSVVQQNSITSVCNQTNILSNEVPRTSDNTTTVYSSFIVSNNQSITASLLAPASAERQNLEAAYDDFVESEVGTLVGAASRRLRRRLVAVGVENGSPNLYQVEDTACPSGVEAGSLCQLVFGSFELLYRNEPNPEGLRSQVETALQQAIANGNLQSELDQVAPDSALDVAGPGSDVTPRTPGPAPGPSSSGDDDDNDAFPLLPIIIGASGGLGLCCCCVAIFLCMRGKGAKSSRRSRDGSDKMGGSYPGDKSASSYRPEDDGSKNGLGTFQTNEDDEDDDYQFNDEPDEEQPEQSPFTYNSKPDVYKDEYTEDEEDDEEEEYPVEEDDEEDEQLEGSNSEEEEPEAGMFGATSTDWGANNQQEQGGAWGNQSPWAEGSPSNNNSFFQETKASQPAEEASYYSSNSASKASAKSFGSKKSGGTASGTSGTSGSGSGGSNVEDPPDAFDTNFYDNSAPEVEDVEDSDESSSYDSDVAGEKVKPPVEAQEMYGYEYEESEDSDEEEESYEEEDEEEDDDDEEDDEEEDSDEYEDDSEEEEEEEEGDAPAMTSEQQKHYRSTIEALVREVVPDEIEHVDAMMQQFVGREEELINTLRNMTTGGEEESSEEESSEEESSEEESDDDDDDGDFVEEEVEEDEEEYSSDSDYDEETVESASS